MLCVTCGHKKRSCVPLSKDAILNDGRDSNSRISCNQVYTGRQVNLESHQLVWLGPVLNGKDATTIKNLRNIVDYTKMFENVEDCLEYIEQTQDTTTFLVCVAKLAHEFIPRIHHLPQIFKIYVVFGSETHQKCFSNYAKITEVNQETTHLMDNLSIDVNEYRKHGKYTTFNVFSKSEQSTDVYSESWWKGFIGLLVVLPYPKDSCHKLVEFLRDYYQEKVLELALLSEFKTNYRSSDAVWWYTRPTLLFGVLNEALRQHNIKVMFLFGFLVQDLYEQLKREFEIFKLTHLEDHPILKSYRGQIMHVDEIKQFKIGDYIINNSFFSTSLNRHLALIFINPLLKSNDQFQNVLFELEIDVRQKASNPFANISSLSHFSEELEVLFTTGCKFEIQDIFFDENEKCWLIKMDLDYAHNPQEYLINENNSNTTIRRTLKYCLDRLSTSISHASDHNIDILFNELTDLFPTEEKWITAVKLQCLGGHKFQLLPLHAEPILYFKQALEIWNDYIDDNELNCLVNIGDINMIMSVCYDQRHPADKNLAIMHCDLAISHSRSANGKIRTDYEKIVILNQLANVYHQRLCFSDNVKENASMAIEYLQLAIEEMLKYYSKNDIMIISRIERLAELFVSVDKYDDALANYESVVNIYLQQPKLPLYWIKNIYEQMANIYIKYKCDYNLGLQYQLTSHEYTLKSQVLHRTDDTDDIAMKNNETALSYKKLSAVYTKLGQYNIAYTNLITAMKLHAEMPQSSDIYDTMDKITEIQLNLANISVKLHHFDLASEHLERVLRLCARRPELDYRKSEVARVDVKLANGYAELQQDDLSDQHLARALNICRETCDIRYQDSVRFRTVINGRIQRRKRSSTIVYVTKYNHTRSYIVVFLDSKITNISRRAVYKEIQRIYNHCY